MTTKKPTKHKPEPKPTPPVAIDKSETLARADMAAADSVAEAVKAMADDPRDDRFADVIDNMVRACPTCGTAKTENRCAVCGHQEHDT